MTTRDAADHPSLLPVAIVGMLAIAALPASAALAQADDTVGRVGVSLLAFATPATLVAAGRVQRRAWMMSLGVTLAVVLFPVVTLATFTGLALLSIFVGPVVAAITVGLPLRDADVGAAAGFLGGGTIAVIGGFAATPAGAAAATGVILVAAVTGLAVTGTRLRRSPAPA